MKRLWILLSLALMLGTAAANAQPATETFAPTDNGKALVTVKRGSGALTLQTTEGVNGYQLCDVSGRTLARVKHVGTEVVVPTIGMTHGVYVVKVATQTGREITVKITL